MSDMFVRASANRRGCESPVWGGAETSCKYNLGPRNTTLHRFAAVSPVAKSLRAYDSGHRQTRSERGLAVMVGLRPPEG